MIYYLAYDLKKKLINQLENERSRRQESLSKDQKRYLKEKKHFNNNSTVLLLENESIQLKKSKKLKSQTKKYILQGYSKSPKNIEKKISKVGKKKLKRNLSFLTQITHEKKSPARKEVVKTNVESIRMNFKRVLNKIKRKNIDDSKTKKVPKLNFNYLDTTIKSSISDLNSTLSKIQKVKKKKKNKRKENNNSFTGYEQNLNFRNCVEMKRKKIQKWVTGNTFYSPILSRIKDGENNTERAQSFCSNVNADSQGYLSARILRF